MDRRSIKPHLLKVVSTLRLGKFDLFFSAFMAAATIGNVEAATDGDLIEKFPRFNGIVEHVTKDGLMLVRPSDESAHTYVQVREVGIKVKPVVIMAYTIAREITCDVIYDTGEYLGGNCVVDIRDQIKSPLRLPENHDTIVSATGLSFPLVSLFLFAGGTVECAEDDREFIPEEAERYSHLCE